MPKPPIHLYCDESCHLEHDGSAVMVLGALWSDATKRDLLGRELKAIKAHFGIGGATEIKWTKVSPGALEFYLALVDWFFSKPELRFRAIVVPNKGELKHEVFNQTHNDFYYKMWWAALNHLIDEDHSFRIFIDIKDTSGKSRIDKLGEVLRNANYDFDKQIIGSIELVRSHHVPLIQIADLFTGAIGYVNRGLATSPAKLAVLERIKERSGHALVRSTLPSERKFNVFVWRAR